MTIADTAELEVVAIEHARPGYLAIIETAGISQKVLIEVCCRCVQGRALVTVALRGVSRLA